MLYDKIRYKNGLEPILHSAFQMQPIEREIDTTTGRVMDGPGSSVFLPCLSMLVVMESVHARECQLPNKP